MHEFGASDFAKRDPSRVDVRKVDSVRTRWHLLCRACSDLNRRRPQTHFSSDCCTQESLRTRGSTRRGSDMSRAGRPTDAPVVQSGYRARWNPPSAQFAQSARGLFVECRWRSFSPGQVEGVEQGFHLFQRTLRTSKKKLPSMAAQESKFLGH